MFHAGETAAFADGGIERIARARRAEQLDIGAAEAADGLRRQRHLAHRLERDRLAIADGELAGDIESADRFQRVAKEIEPQRLFGAGHVKVQNAAAHGEFADIAHGRHALEAGRTEPRDELVHLDLVAGFGHQALRRDCLDRRNALQDCVDGGEDDRAMRLGFQRDDAGQRIEPPRGGIRTRRDAVIRQAVPGRQFQHRQGRIGKGQRLGNRRQALSVPGDKNDRRVGRGLGGGFRQRKGFVAVGNAIDDKLAGAALRQADGWKSMT